MTTDFERDGHDIKVLTDNGGFLVVLKADAGFWVEQIEIDRADFLHWIDNNARELAAEKLSDIDRLVARRGKEPQIFLYYVPRTGRGRQNLRIALDKGVWGFPESDTKVVRGLSVISQIRPGDIVVVIHNFTADPECKSYRWPFIKDKYVGSFESIIGLVATSKLYQERHHQIWPDQQYPWRFKFRRPHLFIGHDIPCSRRALGDNLHDLLRRIQVTGFMQKVDGSSMTKLMSLCTK